MAYKYAGNVFDAAQEQPKTYAKKRTQFSPDKCGTYAGYRRHQKHKVPFCEPCRDAQRAYDREYTERCRGQKNLNTRGYNPDKCGTVAGYAQHHRYGIQRCQPCLNAWTNYTRDWKKRNGKS